MLNYNPCLLFVLFYVSSGILSVLQTPPVMRRTVGLLRDAAASASVTKPQSILSAVRHKTSSARLTWDGVYTASSCYRQSDISAGLPYPYL